MIIKLENEERSQAVAEQLVNALIPPLVIGFSGSLGAGKTTFVRAMLRSLGITGPVKSPTYALIESYECGDFTVHHFDLYRIASEDELEFLGFRDCLTNDAICCIEWPENTDMSRNLLDLQCIIHMDGEGRLLEIRALTPNGELVLNKMVEPK